ncbi:hypothetical protein V1264_003648 [Littorina saxatilis]|uniref:Fatty acyl-CoA reductase n=1 Tax=Littorina saxatilis TaxID=31220 RepID=A0AAN9B9A7_9CAEN
MEQSERLTAERTEVKSFHPTNHKTDAAAAKSSFSGELTVPKFYTGKTVFLTGATGFVGKVLIEKLLRCCPGIRTIYCLIRPKNNQGIHQRLSELTDSKLFDKVRKEQPDFERKIMPVCGDVIQPELGISEHDRQTLEREVHIVFHSAATIKFDETLRLVCVSPLSPTTTHTPSFDWKIRHEQDRSPTRHRRPEMSVGE